jgi:4-aminobutyrate aminotransferase-like enzyme
MDATHGGLGGTYGGNPVACAAALASIDAFENDGLLERAREIGGSSAPASSLQAPTRASATCAATAR